MDRHALVDVVRGTAQMQVGGFVYPFHEMSTPRAELEKKLGYQKDIKPAVQEARRSAESVRRWARSCTSSPTTAAW
jgi:peptide/nickel transport system substrate-binding protein